MRERKTLAQIKKREQEKQGKRLDCFFFYSLHSTSTVRFFPFLEAAFDLEIVSFLQQRTLFLSSAPTQFGRPRDKLFHPQVAHEPSSALQPMSKLFFHIVLCATMMMMYFEDSSTKSAPLKQGSSLANLNISRQRIIKQPVESLSRALAHDRVFQRHEI